MTSKPTTMTMQTTRTACFPFGFCDYSSCTAVLSRSSYLYGRCSHANKSCVPCWKRVVSLRSCPTSLILSSSVERASRVQPCPYRGFERSTEIAATYFIATKKKNNAGSRDRRFFSTVNFDKTSVHCIVKHGAW